MRLGASSRRVRQSDTQRAALPIRIATTPSEQERGQRGS